MSDFLPDGYDLPKSKNNYMRLEEGENRFRVLSSAITGWEYWTDEDGARRPNRVRKHEDVPSSLEDKPKHFWAFCVLNVGNNEIQILQLTQKGVMKDIKALVASKDWGDPKDYDITITRKGKNWDNTEYSVMPNPKTPVDEAVVAYYSSLNINLEALYDNEDPFGPKQTLSDKDIDGFAKRLSN